MGKANTTPLQVRCIKVGSLQMRETDAGPLQVGTGEYGALQVRLGQHCSLQLSATEAGVLQMRTSQYSPLQTNPGFVTMFLRRTTSVVGPQPAADARQRESRQVRAAQVSAP